MGAQPKTNDYTALARRLLRQWLLRGDEAISGIDGLGRAAIRTAAEAARRLERGTASAESSNDVLRKLQTLADAHAPVQPRRLRFGWGGRPPGPTAPDLNSLVESLEGERDKVARALIAVETDTAKLQDAESCLKGDLELIRACHAAVAAAARELSFEQPERANFLSGTLVPRLVERERDVLTQLAVTQQGGLALKLVVKGQEALGKAIERARDTSVAALRTAIAARHAIEGNRGLLLQAEALDRTADATRATSASRREAERALADALMQVRRAIDAAQVVHRAP